MEILSKGFLVAALFAVALARVVSAEDSKAAEDKFIQKAERWRADAMRDLSPRVALGEAKRPGPYAWKTNIVSASFSIGDKEGKNGASAWDPEWQKHYGGYDDPDPETRRDFAPAKFIPQANPFYVALPYNDVAKGMFKPEAREVIPWFRVAFEVEGKSVCRDRWIAIRKGDRTCYAQWSDCGPGRSDNWEYVFGDERPAPNASKGAGILVSPAVREYLQLQGEDLIDWRFIEFQSVPTGPWAKFGKNNTFVQRAKALEMRVIESEEKSPEKRLPAR